MTIFLVWTILFYLIPEVLSHGTITIAYIFMHYFTVLSGFRVYSVEW
jgi:hypothetical protein